MVRKALGGVLAYLSDWRNWLSHGLVGVALIVVPLALPLPPAGRAAAFVGIVALNVLRMRLAKRREAKAAAAETE